MDGLLLLPPGIVVNQPGVYQEVAKFDTLPDDKIRACWHAYTVTNKKLGDPTARRLENFWWHVWGSDRRYLSGRVLAKLYKDISTGPTAVPIRGLSQNWMSPITLAHGIQHSDKNALPQLDVPLISNQSNPSPEPASSIPTTEFASHAASVVSPVPSTAITTCHPFPPTNTDSPASSYDSHFLSNSTTCLALTTKPESSAAFAQSPPLAIIGPASTSTSVLPQQAHAPTSTLIATDFAEPAHLQQPQPQPQSLALSAKPSSGIPNPGDPDWPSDSTQADTRSSSVLRQETSALPAVPPPPPPSPPTSTSVSPSASATMSSAVAFLPQVSAMSVSPAALLQSSLNHNKGPMSLAPILVAAKDESSSYISEEGGSFYVPIKLPPPSSRRPAPRQSILKKDKSSTAPGTTRPTARFASPDDSEKRRTSTPSIVQTQSSQPTPTTRGSTEGSKNAGTSGLAPSRMSKKKPASTGKQTKKFVASTAVKRRPGLGRRSNSNVTTVYYDSQETSSRLPLPTNSEAPQLKMSQRPSNRPPPTPVVVHNTRPSLVSSLSSQKMTAASPPFPSPAPLAPTPEEEEEDNDGFILRERGLKEKPLVNLSSTATVYGFRPEATNETSSFSKKMAGKQPELRPAPLIHRASSGSYFDPGKLYKTPSEQTTPMFALNVPGTVTRRPSQISPVRPRPTRAQSQIDLPTASVQATKRRLERSYAANSSNMSAPRVLAPSNGFPPRRRDSASTEHNVPPPGSVEDTKHLPPLRRSHSTQSRAHVGMYGLGTQAQPPLLDNNHMAYVSRPLCEEHVDPKEPTTPDNKDRSKSRSSRAYSTPRNQRLFASPIKRNERRGLVSPPSVSTYVDEIRGTVYDFGNVDVQLTMSHSRVEPLMETDYGIAPFEPVRGPLDPMFKPSKPSTVPPVHLGRTRSQLALIMDRDAAARGGMQAEGRTFFSGILPWLKERCGPGE
ncbi:hypothetical protein HOO65_070205 [Ceratocystis lukuohia]|uniref:Nitrogen regulatory protein areA GATA-like domain-containing protein n=1 Tax=Ceratocystis lukuohia TaxID=2019550 RepID=A0ABR4MBT3_9PEZI